MESDVDSNSLLGNDPYHNGVVTLTNSNNAVQLWVIFVSILFAALSACFSGLTIGLMSQDTNYLKMLVDASELTKIELSETEKRVNNAIRNKRKDNVIEQVEAGNFNNHDSTYDIIEHSFSPKYNDENNIPDEYDNNVHFNKKIDSRSNIIQQTPSHILRQPSREQNHTDFYESLSDEETCLHSENEDLVRLKKLKELKCQGDCARKILEIRKDAHLLLVSLLVGNVSVNAGFSILMGDVTSSITGFLISTCVILILGEIIPQAICCREDHALVIGYYATPFLQVIEILLWPLCKPIAFFLDKTVGFDHGSDLPNKDELKALIAQFEQVSNKESDSSKQIPIYKKLESTNHHNGNGAYTTRASSLSCSLDSKEITMLKNILNFSTAKVTKSIMPMSEVFWLPATTILDKETLSLILEVGYSRIPVLDAGDGGSVVGILHTKDLIGFPLNTKINLKTILNYIGRIPLKFGENEKLWTIFEAMRSGDKPSHMAIIEKRKPSDNNRRRACEKKHPHSKSGMEKNNILNNDDQTGGSPGRAAGGGAVNSGGNSSIAIGVVTLEDVVEAMLGMEISDEYDSNLGGHQNPIKKYHRIRRYHTLAKFEFRARCEHNQKIKSLLKLFQPDNINNINNVPVNDTEVDGMGNVDGINIAGMVQTDNNDVLRKSSVSKLIKKNVDLGIGVETTKMNSHQNKTNQELIQALAIFLRGAYPETFKIDDQNLNRIKQFHECLKQCVSYYDGKLNNNQRMTLIREFQPNQNMLLVLHGSLKLGSTNSIDEDNLNVRIGPWQLVGRKSLNQVVNQYLPKYSVTYDEQSDQESTVVLLIKIEPLKLLFSQFS